VLPDPTPGHPPQPQWFRRRYRTCSNRVNFKKPICLPLTPFWPLSFLFDPGISAVESEDAGFSLAKSFRSFCVPPLQKPNSPSCQSGAPRSDPECPIPPAFCLIPSTQVHRVPYPQAQTVWSHSVLHPINRPCGARHFDLKMRLPWGCVQCPMPVRAHYLFICVTFFVAVI
jgi:hypothetical protein